MARVSETYDVIVVGGGPAGSTASRLLALAGARVVVLERESLPRYKACGGGLTPKSTALLPFPISSVPSVQVSRIDFRLRGGSPVSWDLAQDFPFYMVMRADLDYRLVESAVAAGVELIAPAAVQSVQWEGNGFAVIAGKSQYRAPFLIGADGATGVVRRALGLASRCEMGIALECELEVADSVYRSYSSGAVFDVEAAPGGYGWIFPKASHLSVGLETMKARNLPLQRLLRDFIVNYGLASTALAEEAEIFAHPLPVATSGEAARCGNALLVGDAAGLADGFGGEGICHAIASGKLAAAAVIGALSGELRALQGYEGDLDRLIRRDHGWSNVMGRIVRLFPDPAYFILTSVGEGRSVLIPLLLGHMTFAEALKRLPRLAGLGRSRPASQAEESEMPFHGS